MPCGTISTSAEVLLIVLPFPEPEDLLNDLRQNLPGTRIEYFQVLQNHDNACKLDEIPKDLLTNTTVLCTLQYFPDVCDVPRLRFIQLVTSGIDHVRSDPMISKSPLPVATVSGIHGPPVAEWVLMHWLVSTRMYDKTLKWQKGLIWPNHLVVSQSLPDHVGKRVGILGYGGIGRQVARLCDAMGMQILVYTSSPRLTPESKRYTGYTVPGTGDPDGKYPTSWYSGNDKKSLHFFLSQSLDYLLISLPLTPKTNRMIGAEELSILSSSCKSPRAPVLTNISRGKILDQDALIASLHSGEISGAALDVTDPEPLPADHPLWDAPNVRISPHISFSSTEYFRRVFDVLQVNLSRMQKGEKLLNEYDSGRGY